MSGKLLDGRTLAKSLREQLKNEVALLKKETNQVPTLVNIMIGNDQSSCVYAKSQKKVADFIGINYKLESLPEDVSQDKLIEYIKSLNSDQQVNGIMIHRPIPSHIDYQTVANYVDITKDLEGINVANIGKMVLEETNIIPCTPAAVMELVLSTQVPLEGKEVVIVGHSEIVGKPLSLLFLNQLATVTVCHIGTSKAGMLESHVQRADILVVAVGKAGLIKGDWIKEGAIVIDVGINKVGNEIKGDVEFEAAERRAAYITPVPGGVGPVTVTILMKNGLEAFKIQSNNRINT